MALPALQKTWTITPNNLITFVSLLDTSARYLFGVKDFLETNGYTVVGSSDGAAAGMDGPGTDRWVSFADTDTRGATAASPQSWIILRDGNGVDILITFQGSTDGTARISFSVGQLFTLAGTPTHQPTATDEVICGGGPQPFIGADVTNRRWNGWVDSTSKLCRFQMFSVANVVGVAWGVEEVEPVAFGDGVVWTPPVFGWVMGNGVSYINGGTAIGNGRVRVGGLFHVGGSWMLLGAEAFGSTLYTHFNNVNPGLQGINGFPLFPLTLGSITAGRSGKLAKLYDWWLGRTPGAASGDTYGTLQFIHCVTVIGGPTIAAGVWPWDGVTTPIIT